MLFNSYLFLFAFLPATLLCFYGLATFRNTFLLKIFLIIASLFFYGFFNWQYLYLIGASLVINFILINCVRTTRFKWVLIVGIVFNVAVIGYFKYFNFFISNINAVFGLSWAFKTIILPLAISFFTIQKIAFLIDAYRGKVEEFSFIDYCCFVLFFPQLIAGPIVLPKEIFPQINSPRFGIWNLPIFAEGFTIFVMGLAKKILIADSLSNWIECVYLHVGNVTFVDGWSAALAFAFQLYFDFSGYSDMAIGLGKMFGIQLPMNFNAPYAALDIRDFWKRWHMTLSRFLREYIYIPLGGNRVGNIRQYCNIMMVMLIGGLWHGASWNFVIWGGLHGGFLCINHQFAKFSKFRLPMAISMVVTFVVIVIAWVFFRAPNLMDAMGMLKGMVGGRGFTPINLYDLPRFEIQYIVFLALYVWVILELRIQNNLKEKLFGTMVGAVLVGIIFALSIIFIKRTSAFLYFQF